MEIAIIVVVSFIVLQSIATRLYAYIMRRRFKNKTSTNSLDDNKDEEEKRKSFVSWLKTWIDGYIRYKLFLLSYFPSHRIRKFVLKNIYMMGLKRETVLYYGFEIRDPWNIKIGKSIIGDKSILDGRMGIEIGDNVNFSTGVKIWTLQHNVNDPLFRCLDEGKKVVVEDRAWISGDCTILPGVRIGEGAVVATGAVVTKNVSPFNIVGGIPAKKIGERNTELIYTNNGMHGHFL